MLTEDQIATITKSVTRTAKRMAARTPHGFTSFEDMVQEAWVRILSDVDAYEPDKSSLRTYADRLALWGIAQHLRACDHLSRTHRREVGDAAPTVRAASQFDLYSRSGSGNGSFRSDRQHTEPVAPPHHPDEMADDQWREFVAEVFGGVTEQEARLLDLYYRHELGMREVGRSLGVSESRVSQMCSALVRRAEQRTGRKRVKPTNKHAKNTAAHSAKMRATMERYRQAGVCMVCKGETDRGGTMCSACVANRVTKTRARHAAQA